LAPSQRGSGAITSELQDDLASIEPYESKLVEAAPEGALAFFSGNGYGKVRESLRDTPRTLDRLRQLLGIDAEGLFALFEGEFAFWVGPGAPLPELTFLAEVEDEAEARATLDRLAAVIAMRGGAETRTTEVDGVQAKQVVIDGFPITYAVFDGRVIITSRSGAISDVRQRDDSLADDADFKQAAEDAGMGDSTFGFVYLDFEQLASLLEGFGAFSDDDIPPEVTRNIEPLGALLFYAGGEAEDLKLSAFLAIE
jgi:hypothetical protein